MLLDFGILAIGFVILIGGAELMVRYASKLGLYYGLAPVIIGTTIVAFGTSAPEFVVSFMAALDGKAGMAFGNAVGSNIANIGLVLGLTALVSAIPVARSIIYVEYLSALLASALVVYLFWDRSLDANDGVILCLAFGIFFTIYAVRAVKMSRSDEPRDADDTVEAFAGHGRTRIWVCWTLTAVGIVCLMSGARLVTDSAESLAARFGMSREAIGATVVALGTSLPEVAASIVAAMKKEHELALGNILGSNLFNMLFVLGPCAIAVPGGLETKGNLDLEMMGIMLGISVLLLPMLMSGKINRFSGGLLLVIYSGFILMMLGDASGWF